MPPATEIGSLTPDGVDVVTGGGGFIGSHLVDRLIADGRQVCVLDNFSVGNRRNLEHHKDASQFELVEGDVRDRSLVERLIGKAERVFHLAARADIVPSTDDPREYFGSNVDGTFEVLAASRAAGIKRFIYAASSSCYGIPDVYPTPEDTPIQPQYPYALTKYLGEELVMHWEQVYGISFAESSIFQRLRPPRPDIRDVRCRVRGVSRAASGQGALDHRRRRGANA